MLRGNARGPAPSARRSDGPGKHLATKKSKPKLTSASHSDPALVHEPASACMRRAKKAAAGCYRLAAFLRTGNRRWRMPSTCGRAANWPHWPG